MEYTFTFKYQLPSHDSDMDALVERLAEEGCDDALVGVGQPGRLALEFVREAPSAREAIESALEDVRRAVPGARLIEATPDFVGLTDVAEVVGMSRQGMRKLMVSYTSSFPAPVHEGSASIWHLADVLSWMQDKGTYTVPQCTLDVARVAMQVNINKEHKRVADAPSLRALAY
jgi:predicted DNA-binding transcriptional regulator AlpA